MAQGHKPTIPGVLPKMETPLRFQPWQSLVEPSFWGRLGEVKLHEMRLEEGPVAVRASYAASNHAAQSGPLRLSADSLGAAVADKASPPHAGGSFSVSGELFCVNSAERVASFDRDSAAQRAADAVWAAIQSGEAEREPSLLQRLVLVAYCDLKHYKFHHWFGFPTLQPPTPFTLACPPASASADEALAPLQAAVLAACTSYSRQGESQPLWLLHVGVDGGQPRAHALSEWHTLSAGGVQAEQVYLVLPDPSCSAQHPGWPLRSALLLAAARWACGTLLVLCLRTRRGKFDADASVVLHVVLPQLPPGFTPKAVGGWERHADAAAGPRIADLGPSMDPVQQASSSVDLNLQLMRWRAAPALDVSAVAAQRCLLLGAGTLGCSVARALLGWGVRQMTFVDNSRVSFSNPVRQSLFKFEDCLRGGQPKAAAAAAAVARIFPGAQAEGIELCIPMPGHPPPAIEVEATLRAVEELDALVQRHDVVFMLLDTREARWLPTLLAAAHNKLGITAALGFDGFMVMRHGVGAVAAEENDGVPPRLGCYFCSDVVAPANSTVDRALDQQCTVARPGLSGVAGSLAVELMAAVMAHPQGAAAPAAGTPAAAAAAAARSAAGIDDEEALPLGDPPHMVRGQLTGFSQLCLSGQAFRQCTACSHAAVEAYRRRGPEFVLHAVSDQAYLKEVTGLAQLQRAAEEAEAAAEAEAELQAAQEEDRAGGELSVGSDGWEEL